MSNVTPVTNRSNSYLTHHKSVTIWSDQPMVYFYCVIMDSSSIDHVNKLFSDRQLNKVLVVHTSIAALVTLEHGVKYALSGTDLFSTPAMITHGLVTTGRLPDDYQSDVQVVATVRSVYKPLLARSTTCLAPRWATAIWLI